MNHYTFILMMREQIKTNIKWKYFPKKWKMEKSTKIAASNFDNDQLSLGCIRRDTPHIKIKSKMILPKNWQLDDVAVRKERKFHSLNI